MPESGKQRVSRMAVVATALCLVFVLLAVLTFLGALSETQSGSYAEPETMALPPELQRALETASLAMADIDDAGLQELLLQSAHLMDTQFQYWMSVSFAVIVAVFVAGKHLTGRFRVLISILYLAISALFFIRLIGSGFHFNVVAAASLDRGLPVLGGAGISPAIRYVTFLVGGCTTIWFTLRGQIGESVENVLDAE